MIVCFTMPYSFTQFLNTFFGIFSFTQHIAHVISNHPRLPPPIGLNFREAPNCQLANKGRPYNELLRNKGQRIM